MASKLIVGTIAMIHLFACGSSRSPDPDDKPISATPAPMASPPPPSSSGSASKAPEMIAIRANKMIDPRSGKVFTHAVLVVNGETIEAIGEAVPVPPGAHVVDLGDATLIPGLIDDHSHLLLKMKRTVSIDDGVNLLLHVTTMSTAKRALLGAANAREELFSGITTVRDVGNSGVLGDVALRDAIASQWVTGPTVVACTRALAPVGGQFGPLQPAARALIDEDYVTITGTNEARRAVRQAVYDGADCIKIIVDGASLDAYPVQSVLSADELHAIVDEAHRAKRRVAAHATTLEGARAAVEAGADSVEHGYGLTEDVLRAMASKKIFLVPTDRPLDEYVRMLPYARSLSDDERKTLTKELTEFHAANMKRLGLALKLGVRVAFGSDQYYDDPGWTRGQSSLVTLRAYREAGMPPLAILRAATWDAATLLFVDPKVGALEVGKTADLIAVTGDPLASIDALDHVAFVMARGAIVRDDLAHTPPTPLRAK